MSDTLLITNIKAVYGTESHPSSFKKGKEMSETGVIENAWILAKDGKISDFGQMVDAPHRADKIIDASDGCVFPTWCDSHSHIVFAGSREGEYVDKLKGVSYEVIAAKGGGILNSAKKLQLMSEEALYEAALERLEKLILSGTGAIEIKSGYGLTFDSELKMLRVIRKLKENTEVTIKSSFLGAHAYPVEFRDNHRGYIDIIINKMLPAIADEGLADYCDAFCEKGFFSVDETDEILQAAAKNGLKPKIHANQLSVSGGVQVGVKNHAVSVDHLEEVGDEEIEALLNSDTIPTVLPSCSFFLNISYAPARKMIDKGLGIAIATDYNPGSSPSGNIPLMMAIACNNMRILPVEAFNGVTNNGAFAMELQHSHGTIARGKVANFIISKPIPSLDYLIYDFGNNNIEKVIINGKIA